MDSSGIIPGIVGGLVAAAIGLYLVNKAKHRQTNGQLYFGHAYVTTGFLSAGMVLVCILMGLVADTIRGTSDLFVMAALILAFSASAAYFFLEYFGVKGNYDDSSITLTTPWSGTKTASFTELVSVKFNPIAYWYVLRFNDGTCLRISSYLQGHGTLVEKLKREGYELD